MGGLKRIKGQLMIADFRSLIVGGRTQIAGGLGVGGRGGFIRIPQWREQIDADFWIYAALIGGSGSLMAERRRGGAGKRCLARRALRRREEGGFPDGRGAG
jgi:hypothetical protein